MPALPTPLALEPLAAASSFASDNTTANVLQVVCAWPVSGQYGPGSRVLYYVLVATCLLAQNVGWLVNACLAVALIFPAVAALHAIVLAAVHVDGAVDMDIFGAFQLLSIGILAAPITVMLSKTYFNDPGRNLIFAWALLILTGLLSLAVEFYRTNSVGCPHMFSNAAEFIRTNDEAITCGLHCSLEDPENAPKSPLRGGANDNIYIIPAPSTLTFGTTTLLAVACCLHTILCLFSMWSKVVERKLERHLKSDEQGPDNETISGTNGATRQMMKNINDTIRHYLRMIAVPVFGGAGLAIIIVGEINFFSPQVQFQTEPMASVGQWGPIAGTGMAVLGSVYLLAMRDEEPKQCDCEHSSRTRSRGRRPSDRPPMPILGSDGTRNPSVGGPMVTDDTPGTTGGPPRQGVNNAGRNMVAQVLNRMGDVLGTPPRSLLQDQVLGPDAYTFPQVPAEIYRDGNLRDNMTIYETMVENHSRSRSTSVRGSSPSSPRTSRSRSPNRANRATTLPTRRTSPDVQHLTSHPPEVSRVEGHRNQTFGDSLAVPPPALHAGSGEHRPPLSTIPARTRRRISSPARFSGNFGHRRTFTEPTTESLNSISMSSLSSLSGLPSPSEPGEEGPGDASSGT